MNRRFGVICISMTFVTGLFAGMVRAQDKTKIPDLTYVRMKTNMGDIVLELNQHKAPITVKNFLDYVDSGFYSGTIFHRVAKDFIIQGGGYDANRTKKGTKPAIKNEWTNGLKHRRGTIAMARTQKNASAGSAYADSGTSQFFINLKDNNMLDRPMDGAGYAVFGRVIGGLEVVERISHAKTENLTRTFGRNFEDWPVEPVSIESVMRVNPNDIQDLIAAAKASDDAAKPQVPLGDLQATIATDKGEINLTLYPDKVPLTVANFVNLAQRGYYDGLTFHRVVNNFMIQGGDPDGNGRGGPGYKFEDEFHPELRHDGPGVLSMANSGKNTNGSQFFITHKDTPHLNNRHSVFGRVVSGQSVVDSIIKGDVMKSVKIVGDAKTLFEKHKKKLEEWNTILDVKYPRKGATPQDIERAKEKLAELEKKQREEMAAKNQEAMNTGRELVKSKGADITKGTTSETGLWHVDVTEGSGAMPIPTDRVKVHYTGWLVNGSKFDSSLDRGSPATFPLNGVIKGWTEGLSSMKAGGKRFLVIPPELAYGSAARPKIPADSTLVFEVELLGINE